MTVKKKYYWFVYQYNNAGGGITVCDDTCHIHPFTEIARLSKDAGHAAYIRLLNWKEITGAEYDLYHSN